MERDGKVTERAPRIPGFAWVLLAIPIVAVAACFVVERALRPRADRRTHDPNPR